MLDPRVYRTGLIVAALALVVLAFSLKDEPAPLTPTLAPSVFSGQNVVSNLNRLATSYPLRSPGSPGDQDLAATIRDQLGALKTFIVSTDTFSAHTVDGTRSLQNVIAVKPGLDSGSLVIVAPRDALGQPALASLSGTATMLELAGVLDGETLNHTVVLASTSGTDGTAGATRLAASLAGPVDAVIVLGDLASAHLLQPIVIPWSTGATQASPVLGATLGSAIAAQTTLTSDGAGLLAQFAHLAFPFALGEQGPFLARGIPAVTLSASGELGPGAGAPIDQATLTGLGQSVLETISALDTRPAVPAPSGYLTFDDKIVPGWAISLFVLALILPVAMTTLDGVARARRRGQAVGRWLVVVLAAAIPFALALLVVFAAGMIGAIPITTPGPALPGTIPAAGSGIAVLAVAGLAGILAAAAELRWGPAWLRARLPSTGDDPLPVRPRGSRGAHDVRARAAEPRAGDGAVAALMVIMCAVTVAVWVVNPFAAALLIPALHLWLWALDGDLPLPAPARVVMLAIGLTPIVWVAIYDANVLHAGAAALVWAAALMVASHGVSPVAAVEWSVVAGCVVSAVTLAVRGVRGSSTAVAPITVRGPASYAGPGSLGGTKSALRR